MKGSVDSLKHAQNVLTAATGLVAALLIAAIVYVGSQVGATGTRVNELGESLAKIEGITSGVPEINKRIDEVVTEVNGVESAINRQALDLAMIRAEIIPMNSQLAEIQIRLVETETDPLRVLNRMGVKIKETFAAAFVEGIEYVFSRTPKGAILLEGGLQENRVIASARWLRHHSIAFRFTVSGTMRSF